MTGPKILSIDDSRMIHTLIGKGFSSYQVQLSFASNGVEGLAAAAREMPDLIILDVTMPVMDGIECLMKLKGDPALRDIPVIMLTAEAGKENVLKIAKMGVRDYMVKPFTEQALIDRCGRVVDLKPKGAAATRTKSIDDPATILVIDEHAVIIETIRGALQSTTWKVLGTDQCGEAAQLIAKDKPDAVIVSLSLPNKAALNFFHLLRSNASTQSTPVLGLSVKTAQEEQGEAKSCGFAAIITKPIDATDLAERLARAMNLDTSSRYFSVEKSVQFVKIPQGITPAGSSELSQYIGPKVRGMVEAGLNRLIIDMSEISKLEILMIKLMLTVISACRELDIRFRVVGSSEFVNQAKAFEETTELEIFPSREAALEGF